MAPPPHSTGRFRLASNQKKPFMLFMPYMVKNPNPFKVSYRTSSVTFFKSSSRDEFPAMMSNKPGSTVQFISMS